MEVLLPNAFLDTLLVGLIFSVVLMVLIQKLKSMKLVTKPYHIAFANLICAFGLGIPFSMNFYSFDLVTSIWVGIFTFIGAPAIYEALKAQNFINFTPNSLSNYIEVPKENEIKRD